LRRDCGSGLCPRSGSCTKAELLRGRSPPSPNISQAIESKHFPQSTRRTQSRANPAIQPAMSPAIGVWGSSEQVLTVIPAQAGIQCFDELAQAWMPAFAGMTTCSEDPWLAGLSHLRVLCVLCGQKTRPRDRLQFDARISAPPGATGTPTGSRALNRRLSRRWSHILLPRPFCRLHLSANLGGEPGIA
jgi:hypothetical protein